jgi:hypothetical protein
MPGGLLNLVSVGQENILLFGDAKKTFFKSTYKKITNFGMQKFRIDYSGSRTLRMNTSSVMEFKVPRYAELLYDTYIVMNLPDIWSPIYVDESFNIIEYGFKWIEEIGSNIIENIEITSNGQLLSSYTGEYISNVIQRDQHDSKKDLWNRMTGNVPELYDPANAFDRINVYPTAYNDGTTLNVRPSIIGRKLYIPIGAWFCNNISMALPLISLQYAEVCIKITFRPIRELYIIRDVKDSENNYPYIAPNTNLSYQQFHNFINPPEDPYGNVTVLNDEWNADVHLISTYIFLDTIEREIFAKNSQSYLIKDVYTWNFPQISGSQTIKLDSRGLVSNYMFRFRRSDVFQRNTWSNYTNWPYNTPPYEISNEFSPNPTIFITGNYTSDTLYSNNKNILMDMALLLDGKYRENQLDSGIYNYIEKYNNTASAAKDGIYIYSFSLNTDFKKIQPSGAMNMDKFKNIQFQINTIEPPIDPSASYVEICDGEGNIIGTRKNLWSLNDYNYDLTIFEERYNVLEFSSGLVGLKYAR